MIQPVIPRAKKATVPVTVAIALAAVPAQAEPGHGALSPKAKALIIEHAGIDPQGDKSGMAAAYLTVWNGTPKPMFLVAVQSDGFRSISLHRTERSGGVTRMIPVDRGLEIPPGTELMMKPDGVHVMASPNPGLFPREGTTLTLVFSDGTRVTTRAEVLAPGMRLRDHHHGQGDMGGK